MMKFRVVYRRISQDRHVLTAQELTAFLQWLVVLLADFFFVTASVVRMFA